MKQSEPLKKLPAWENSSPFTQGWGFCSGGCLRAVQRMGGQVQEHGSGVCIWSGAAHVEMPDKQLDGSTETQGWICRFRRLNCRGNY